MDWREMPLPMPAARLPRYNAETLSVLRHLHQHLCQPLLHELLARDNLLRLRISQSMLWRTVALLVVVGSCAAQSPVSSAPFQALPLLRVTEQGITPFLEANSNYSIFLELLEASGVYSELVTGAWMQGPSDNTVLVATNEAIEKGFALLSNEFSVPLNASTYVELANGEAGNAAAAAVDTLLTAILSSHILTQSVAFYSNQTILNATEEQPVKLPVANLGSSAAPSAYSTSEGINERIAVSQPSGLVTQPIAIPLQYINQRGNNPALGGKSANLYLYEVSSILVASQIQDSSGNQISVLDALKTINSATVG